MGNADEGIKIKTRITIKIVSNISFYENIKKSCLKWTYELSGNDYRVATLSNLYLTPIGITMQSWNR